MMFLRSALFLIQLIVVLISVPINEAQESNYIVGGVNAKQGEIPYQVSLQYKKQHICGGSILNEIWILTAAHCVVKFPKSTLTILAGTTKLSSGGVRVEIEKIISYDNYTLSKNIKNDIAIIKLKDYLTYGKNIQPVNLVTGNVGRGYYGTVSGWGFTDQNGTKRTDDLKKLRVRTITNQQCRKSFNDIDTGNLCTLNVAGEGFCQGDSGGPLIEERSKAQMGLVSANVPCARQYPDIYTRISTYVKWILDNVK